MYLFQAGKKLGKRLTGVENFEESEKPVKKACHDMLEDRNKKHRSYDDEDMYGNSKKVFVQNLSAGDCKKPPVQGLSANRQ